MTARRVTRAPAGPTSWVADGTEIDIKRCYLPGVEIADDCPRCGETVISKWDGDEWNYPEVGTPLEYPMFHAHGDTEVEWTVEVRIWLGVEIVR